MELVIVIAVIAVLAAVLIPTFANIIQRANESNDISLARNMNTLLATEQVGGESPSSMEDVMFILDQNGYGLDNLNPTADGNMFIWNSEDNRLVYVDSDGNVLYSENGKYTTIDDLSATSYLTVSNEEEIDKWVDLATNGIGIYLENDITLAENKTFNKPVSIDTAAYKLTGNVTYNVSTECSFIIKGTVGEVEINAPEGTVYNYSSADKITIKAIDSASYHEYGSVDELVVETSNSASHIVIENNAIIKTLTVNGSAQIENNNGYIGTVGGTASESSGITATNPNEYEYLIGSYADLANFRDKINAGDEFDGMTVKLTANINLTGRAWTPIANFYREESSNGATRYFFKGTFDGDGNSIIGLSTAGFSLDNAAIGRNGTTPDDNSNIMEYAYGLFGIVKNATIINLNMTNVNINLPATSSRISDSVGAIVGYAEGLTMRNCTVSGSVMGGDAVGGLVGRCYYNSVTIENCVNNADITGEGRASGLLGFFNKIGSEDKDLGYVADSNAKVTFNSNTNNGDVTCIAEYKNATYFYASGISSSNLNGKGTLVSDGNNKNNGVVTNVNEDGITSGDNDKDDGYQAKIFVLVNNDKNNNVAVEINEDVNATYILK